MYEVVRPQIHEESHHTCPFHERHPGRNFPGCTCRSSYSSRDKPMEDWTEEERDWYFAALCGEKPDGSSLF